MVAPFKPYRKYETRNSSFINIWGDSYSYVTYYFESNGVSQIAPFVNTAYSGRHAYTVYGPWHAANWNNIMQQYVDDARVQATNQARARLVNELGDTSSVGATLLAERKETFGMLVSGVTIALRSARAVRKGDLIGAARMLGIAPPIRETVVKLRRRKGSKKYVKVSRTGFRLPSWQEGSKSLGNKWLWWSYGVQPFMGDMHNSLDVLQREAPWKRIHGRAKATVEFHSVEAWKAYDYVATCKVAISCNVRVKNPNLFLANQLGLTNPLQVINEGLMFSFVLDWFSNLSQIISQFTDFVGLEIDDPVSSELSVLNFVMDDVQYGVRSPGVSAVNKFFSRSLSIPDARLRFAYERFQWQRGANAISLLVQLLKTK